MLELDCEENWAPKNWCFWTVVLEKTLESPLDCKEIQPVHPKGDWSWVFIGGTDAEAETPIVWPPHAKSWLTGKDPDAGTDWGQEEKGTTEDEMARWHHGCHDGLDGRESEWTLGVGDGQGGQACCDSWGSQRVGHHWATELKWIELNWYIRNINLMPVTCVTIFCPCLTLLLLNSVFIARLVKNLPAMQETPVRFLGQEDTLEKG